MTRIYHNPRCSTSRSVLTLIRERGIDVEVVDYQKTPLTVDELDALCRKLNLSPERIIRSGETRFRELGLSLDDGKSCAEWLKILADNPVLIQRPIVVSGDRAIIGRPIESVLPFLDEPRQ